MIYSFKGFIPVVHPSAYVHPQAVVTGNVFIGKDVFIGAGASIRGDFGSIEIKDGCNVQENCIIHMFPAANVVLEKMAHIGHGAVIHGAHIGKNVLIGMNSVVMDDAIIEEESIIGALSFVKANTHIPKRSLVVGNPAKVVKAVSDEMIKWKTKGTLLYQTLPAAYQQTAHIVEPLKQQPENKPTQEKLFETWEAIKKKKT